jgi:hypothetical protein
MRALIVVLGVSACAAAPRPPGRRFRETRILDAYSRHDLEAMFSV